MVIKMKENEIIHKKNRLQELRKEKKLTQAAMAEILSVKQNTVSNWENGLRDIDNDTLRILSDYFDVSIDYILGSRNAKWPGGPKEMEGCDSAGEPGPLETAVEALKKNHDLVAIVNTLSGMPRMHMRPVQQTIAYIGQIQEIQKELDQEALAGRRSRRG